MSSPRATASPWWVLAHSTAASAKRVKRTTRKSLDKRSKYLPRKSPDSLPARNSKTESQASSTAYIFGSDWKYASNRFFFGQTSSAAGRTPAPATACKRQLLRQTWWSFVELFRSRGREIAG